jgi:transmembrane sensor
MNYNPSTPDQPKAPFDWEAIARYLSGESSPTESERIARWLDDHAADAELVAALDKAITSLALRDAANVDVESALRAVTARRDAPVPINERKLTPRPVRKHSTRATVSPWRMVTLLAAAAVIIFAARAVLEKNGRSTTSAPLADASTRTFTTAVGKRDSLRLPDGGRVVLGPGSQLIVAAGYGAARGVREVELHGEAYFDVVHDTTRPFVVRAGGAMVRDVGTSFNVRSDSGSRVQVVVTSGLVALRSAGSEGSSVVLSRGDVGTVQPDGRVSTLRGAPLGPYLAWMRDSLVFREAPISEVSSDLRRWYGVVLRVEDSALARQHLTMTLAGDPVDRVLRMIGLQLGAEVERRGDSAIVRPSTRGPRMQ